MPSFERSVESIEFQQMWQRLPRVGLVPERDQFHPRLAKQFLPHILLAEVPDEKEPSIRIRIVGDTIRRHVQGDMTGLNYLDFLDGEIRKTQAVERVRELFDRPCGHWWIAPVHYERGFSQYWEITTLPLAATARQPQAILALVRPFDSIADGRRAGKILSLDLPVKFEIIDLARGASED